MARRSRLPRSARSLALSAIVVLSVSSLSWGCATYRDTLSRGRVAYERSEHERALVILQGLENDLPRLSTAERTQYFYLRGQSDYRIGYKLDARHWLSLARASEQEHPGALPEAWKARLEESLTALNDEVYGKGFKSLPNVRSEESPGTIGRGE